MGIRELPRAAVETWLRAARIPLSAAETALGREDTERWGPSMAFERFSAGVRQVAGSLLGDDELLTQARLQQTRLEELHRAAAEDARAADLEAEADRRLEQRTSAAEHERDRAKQQADRRRAQARKRKEAARREAEATAERKKAEAADQAADREEAVARRATEAERETLQTEAEVLAERSKAADAKARVEELDEEIRTSKAERAAG